MVATAAAAGSLYAVVQAPPDLSWIVEIATGATIGGLISSCIIGFELFGEARWLERAAAGCRWPLRCCCGRWYTGSSSWPPCCVVPWMYSGEQPSLFRPGIVGDVVFSIAATFVFVSLTSIVQLIGPNVLGSLLAGRYYRPREEERIVVFLDLVGSTAHRRATSAMCASTPCCPRLSRASPGW